MDIKNSNLSPLDNSRDPFVAPMSYQDWRQRNSAIFAGLNKSQQTSARLQGYGNKGWTNVKNSWQILCQLQNNTDLENSSNHEIQENRFSSQISSLLEHKLSKGDILGAIRQAILEADEAKKIATKGILEIEALAAEIQNLAEDILIESNLPLKGGKQRKTKS